MARTKWNLSKARWEIYRENLGERLDDKGVVEMHSELINRIKEAGYKGVGRKKVSKKAKLRPWWNKEIKEERNKRKALNMERRNLERQRKEGREVEEKLKEAIKLYEEQRERTKEAIQTAIASLGGKGRKWKKL